MNMKLLLLYFLSFIVFGYVNTLTCICDRPCVIPTGCKAGTVPATCCGCKVCAKTKGERCGGPWGVGGRCADGLICKKEVKPGALEFNAYGTCACPEVSCYMYCRYGFAEGENKCPICKCKKAPKTTYFRRCYIDRRSFRFVSRYRERFCFPRYTVFCTRNCSRCCRHVYTCRPNQLFNIPYNYCKTI